MADTKTAGAPTADATDIPAEVAELRNIVTALEADRDAALDQVAGLEARLATLEAKPTASGGVNASAVERELGKLRRPLSEVIGSYFRNVQVEPAEPLEPVTPVDNGVAESGSGSTVGATSTASGT